MRLLRRLVILLVALWLVGEILAIPVADRIIADEVAARTRNATSVHASIGSFPVVARMLVFQKVSSVSVRLERVVGERIPFSEIRYDVKNVGIDRGSVFSGKVHVTSVGSGTVTATINLADISPVAGRIASAVHMEGRSLVLGGVRFALGTNLIPCTPQATIEGQQVILSCTIDHIPPVLLEHAQG